MVGFDDAAMMGLGAVNAGVQIAGQVAQKRQQGKLDKMSKQQARRHHGYEMKNLQLEKEQTDRSAGLAQQDSRESDADRGLLNSSQRDYNRGQIEGERSRRQDALDRQIALKNADWMDQERAWKIQRKMQKTAQITSMISSMLLQGGSGVAGQMGASTMAG